jgi:predicted metal-dependent peptidase
MAARSTFGTTLPRDLKRFLDLTNPLEPQLNKTDSKEWRKMFKGAGPEGYNRELRKMFIEAHAHHKAFKLKRLAKEVAADLKEEIATEVAAVL